MPIRHLFPTDKTSSRCVSIIAVRRGLLLAAVALIGAWKAPPAQAEFVQTFVMTVGGTSSWPTFSVAPPVAPFFGTNGVFIPTNPAGLAASDIAGDYRTQTAAEGPIADSMSLNTLFGGPPANSFAGSASAKAVSGKVGAAVQGTYFGGASGLNVIGAQAFGLFQESITIASSTQATGASGFAHFTFSIDGNMAVTSGTGTADLSVMFQKDNAQPTFLTHAQISGATSQPSLISTNGSDVSGFGRGPGTLSGAGTFLVSLPFLFGQTFDFTLGLNAYFVTIGSSSATVDFSSTALLTRIDALDAFGRPIVDFDVSTGSGALYDANGVHFPQNAVPEPSSAVLLGTGALVLLGWRRRDFRRRPCQLI